MRNDIRKLMETLNESVEGDIAGMAGEFTIVEEHTMIHILDGEDVVRLSMFKAEWEDLIRSYGQNK